VPVDVLPAAPHLTIPGKLDAFGATLTGVPLVAVGHNRHVAWTHTVNSSRHFAIHRLALDPGDPTRYLVDGKSRPMVATEVAVRVRLPGGEVGTVTHQTWSSELGPLLMIPGFLDWTGTQAFAFGDANRENTRFLATWWAMDRARSLGERRRAVESMPGIPWVHTIAVDAGGTAYLAT
jgi:acyl-homoserine-lactone acylase